MVRMLLPHHSIPNHVIRITRLEHVNTKQFYFSPTRFYPIAAAAVNALL